jgi:hypothetical protein
MLAMDDNDNAGYLMPCSVLGCIASKLAPTGPSDDGLTPLVPSLADRRSYAKTVARHRPFQSTRKPPPRQRMAPPVSFR